MPLNPSASAGTRTDELVTTEGSGRATTVVSDQYTRASSESPASILSRRTMNTGSGSSLFSTYNQSAEASTNFSNYLGFNNQYDFTYRIFPSDLGADYNAHYMIININVQAGNNGDARTSIGLPNQFGPANYQVLPNELSKVDQLKFGGVGNLPGLTSFEGIGNTIDRALSGETFNVPRYTRRIKESIALFMPIPMVYTHTNVYEEISLTSFGAQALKLGVTAAGKGLAALMTGRIAGALQSGLPRVVNSALGTARQIAGVAGYPINPKIEVIFSHTPQRAFRMELLMAPKNAQESQTVKNIIDTLRFHAAPEISSLGGVIPTFIAPAEFDITFYHRGKENTKVPRINTCALEQVEVDYAPSGIYSTFTNGHPVTVRLSLAFRELEILHKERVTQGF